MRIVGALVVVLALSGCIRLGGGDVVTPSPVEEDFSSLPTEFGGNVVVTAGVDVQPGTYLVEVERPTCEWAKGVDGDLVASGTNDVVLRVGETVEVTGCSVFVKAD